jgi:hypothetical protein
VKAPLVYEKDLGPDTLKTFKSIDRFNPDKTWHLLKISGKSYGLIGTSRRAVDRTCPLWAWRVPYATGKGSKLESNKQKHETKLYQIANQPRV